jgi:PAS domain S-box-containing protein
LTRRSNGTDLLVTGSADAVENRLLDAVLDQMPVGVVVAEAPTGHLIRANRYAQELLGGAIGRSVDERAPFELIDEHGRTLEPVERPLARAVHDGLETHNERIELRRADGIRLTVAASAAPIRGDDGEIVAAVVVFEDISSRASRERADRDFVANAAHELRTPLAAIASAIEVLQAGAKELPAERELFLGHIERESNRLSRLARALLLLARVQTGVEKARLEIVSLRPLLDEVAAATRPARGVRVSVRCRPDVAALTNGELIEQALLNLAANATAHTAHGSITLSARSTQSCVVVEVSDTGSGISKETRERMFERFFRGGARDARGFGLGLAIAQQALEAVGGTIAVDTVEGKETRMRLELPAAHLVEP